MKNLKENIKVAELRIKESEERRKNFIIKYRETGEQLYKELAENEEQQIAKIRIALSEAYIQLREEA